MEQLAIKFPEWTRVAEVELVYKTTIKPSERPKIGTTGKQKRNAKMQFGI